MNRWIGGAWERVGKPQARSFGERKGPFTPPRRSLSSRPLPVRFPAQAGQVLLQGGQVLHIGHYSIDHQHLPRSRSQ